MSHINQICFPLLKDLIYIHITRIVKVYSLTTNYMQQRSSSIHQKQQNQNSSSKNPPNKHKQDGHKNVIPGAKKTFKSAINSMFKKTKKNQQISKKDLWSYINQILEQNKTEHKSQFGTLILIKTFILIFNKLELKEIKKKMKRKKGSHPNEAYLKKKKEEENRVIDAFEILNKPDRHLTQKTIYQCLYKLFFYPKNRQNAVKEMQSFFEKYPLRHIQSDQYSSQQKNIVNEQKKQLHIQNKSHIQKKVRYQQSFDFDERLKNSSIQEQKMGQQIQKVDRQAFIINIQTYKIEMNEQKYKFNRQEYMFIRQEQEWNIGRDVQLPLLIDLSELQRFDKKQLKDEQNEGLVLIESQQFVCASQDQYASNKIFQQLSLCYDMYPYESTTKEIRNGEQAERMQEMEDDNNIDLLIGRQKIQQVMIKYTDIRLLR